MDWMKKTMKLYMTDDEIKISYRDSLHKRRQITILAQLNHCLTSDICLVLGLPIDNIIEVDHSQVFQKYYDQGLIDADIAKRVGVPISTVMLWRRNRGLRPVRLTLNNN
jgi:hypothetical protein